MVWWGKAAMVTVRLGGGRVVFKKYELIDGAEVKSKGRVGF